MYVFNGVAHSSLNNARDLPTSEEIAPQPYLEGMIPYSETVLSNSKHPAVESIPSATILLLSTEYYIFQSPLNLLTLTRVHTISSPDSVILIRYS